MPYFWIFTMRYEMDGVRSYLLFYESRRQEYDEVVY